MLFPAQMHAVSDLQDRAPQIIQEATAGPVGITRYGHLVAALISPEDLASFQELEQAAERALWSFDAERAFRDLSHDEVEDWDKVAKELRNRYGRKK